MQNEKEDLDSWDKFSGNAFLKSTDIANENDAVAVIAVAEVTNKEGKERIQITVEKAGKQYKKDLIAADIRTMKAAGIATPKQVIGKKLYFKKVFVNSPKTHQEVESLRIIKIE